MTTPTTAPADRPSDQEMRTWTVVRDWMAHVGYTPEEIARYGPGDYRRGTRDILLPDLDAAAELVTFTLKHPGGDPPSTAEAQPWHKLHDDAYEVAEAEAAGVVFGLKTARGDNGPAFVGMSVDDFRQAVAAAFDRGFQTARDEAGAS